MAPDKGTSVEFDTRLMATESIDEEQRVKRGSSGAPNVWKGLRTQVRCIEALMVRDLMARYGRGNIGFLWVLLEPMILCVGVMFVWSLIRGDDHPGINLIGFVISGYMPLTLWRHVTNQGIFGLRKNASVFYHRRMSAIDCIVSMSVLEFAGSTAALIVVIVTTITIGLIEPIRDYYSLTLGWLMMASISIGVMLLICALTEASDIWERFIQPFQYLVLPLSGSFFMVDWLPSYVQDVAWYNPTVHCYEMIRRGFIGDAVLTYSDPWYVFAWSLAITTVGLWTLERARNKTSFR